MLFFTSSVRYFAVLLTALFTLLLGAILLIRIVLLLLILFIPLILEFYADREVFVANSRIEPPDALFLSKFI